MCSCQDGRTCPRCLQDDYRVFWRLSFEPDPAEVDADRREALRVENRGGPEPGITRTTR